MESQGQHCKRPSASAPSRKDRLIARDRKETFKGKDIHKSAEFGKEWRRSQRLMVTSQSMDSHTRQEPRANNSIKWTDACMGAWGNLYMAT